MKRASVRVHVDVRRQIASGIRRIATTATTVATLFVTLSVVGVRGDAGHQEPQSSPLQSSPSRTASVDPSQILDAYGQIPLSFEANSGQTDERVKFLARGPGYTVFLANDEAVISLPGISKGKQTPASHNHALIMAPLRDTWRPLPEPRNGNAVVRLHLIGADASAQASGLEPLPGTTNYVLGKDPRNWRTNLANYAKVGYRNVYAGIDLIYYGTQRQLEYDFVVAPGGDPAAIRIGFSNNRPHLDKVSGDLVLNAAGTPVRFRKPVAYQSDVAVMGGHKHFVEARFALNARNEVSFHLGSYDHRQPLVIDPVLGYSTYLGGTGSDYATAIALDASRNAYITGYTSSANFPVTPGAYQPACKGTCNTSTPDAFVTKLNPAGNALVYSTFLGGSGKDNAFGIAVDPSGNAFIVGTTFSADFPVTAGAFQGSCGGSSCASGDGFVSELNATGSGLVYSTYLGGTNANQANAIALDRSGNAYVTGYTRATNFPVTPGVFQGMCASCSTALVDSYVTKLNSSGSALVYSTYLGGNKADVGYAIALDSSENAYVTGYTYSTNFPTTTGAFQKTSNAPTAVFVSKINPTATALSYSTYLGGSATGSNACPACGSTIAVDAGGNAYVAGLTWETNFPTTAGAFQTNFAGGFHDAFVTKLNPTGTGLVYSTYIGGTGDDGATSIVVDSTGIAYIKGNTFSTNYPTTPGTLKSTLVGTNQSDAFVTLLNPAGSALNYSTYLGGSSPEYGGATTMIAIDKLSPPNIYVTGYGNSTNFPVTAGAYQTKLSGAQDAFVVKFTPSPNVGLSAGLNFGNQKVGTTSSPLTITVTNTGNASLNVSLVNISGANASDFKQTNTCTAAVAPQATCAINVTFTPLISGTENATVSVTDNSPTSPESTSLTGVGVGNGPAVTLSPTSLVFASQLVGTTSPAQVVTLTNSGTSVLSITSIATTGDFAQTNTCGATVNAGASCTISVTFTPTTINTRTGTVAVTDNAPASPQIVSLSGTGTYLSWTPSSLNLGSITVGSSSSPQTITFTNHAKTALTIRSITVTGINNQDYTETNNCGTSLASDSSCTINVTFAPLAKGVRTASVTISVFLGGNSTQNVPLSGTGK